MNPPRLPLDVALERARTKRVNACVRVYMRRAKGDAAAALAALASDFDSMLDLHEQLLEFTGRKLKQTQDTLDETHQRRVQAGQRGTRVAVFKHLDADDAKYPSIEVAAAAIAPLVNRAPISVKRYVQEWNRRNHRWGGVK